MFETKTKDNSSLYLKVLLRRSFLNLGAVEKNVALDLFSGKGEIASRAYAEFKELHLVEKDSRQIKGLKEKFLNSERARIWQMDNLKFLHKKLSGFSELNLVDFDAYGSPNQQIKEFFSNWKLKAPLLVFATDGFALARIRGGPFCPEMYFAGADKDGAYGYDSVLAKNYDRLIRGFWEELSKRHKFRIELFKLIWKKGGQVAYYGTLIKPD